MKQKPPRSALPLPRYVRRKRLRGDWGYFFDVPTWARKRGCDLNEPLGTDYAAAVLRAEQNCCSVGQLAHGPQRTASPMWA